MRLAVRRWKAAAPVDIDRDDCAELDHQQALTDRLLTACLPAQPSMR